MKKGKLLVISLALSMFAFLLAAGSVSATPTEKTDGFVCPVLGGQAGMRGMHIGITPIAGGYFTHSGPDVSIPSHVPNEGWPSIADSFLTPGEVGYNAIWDYANAP